MLAHRPFWVLRHRVSGVIKTSANPDLEDAMWEVLLADGSAKAEGDRLIGEIAKARRAKRRERGVQ